MKKEWFEMSDLKKRSYGKTSWVPLCAYKKVLEEGDYGHKGYIEEFLGAIAVMIPIVYSDKALEIEWSEVNPSFDNSPYAEKDSYKPAGYFESYSQKISGKYLVLQQNFEGIELSEWHLSEDLVLALKLKRTEDKWVCPQEDYLEVARLQRDSTGKPVLLEIRSDHLKDYLCANGAGLLVSRFHSRTEIQNKFDDIDWLDGRSTENNEAYRWGGYLQEIHEGGFLFGEKVAVFHVKRTDVDYEEDVPSFGFPTDENVESESWEVRRTGTKLLRALGELWKNDWVEPSAKSTRVRGDYIESIIPFIVNNDGDTECGESLKAESRWLWFKPSVVNDLISRPKGILNWYTEYTGSVGPAPYRDVHFGVNEVGLITVYAKDIAMLSEADKKIWVAHNVSPEGGVSRELLMSQMEANPASTIAPEKIFIEALSLFEEAFREVFKKNIFKEHFLEKELLSRINRFHANDIEGIYNLAKELTRLVIERVDLEVLKAIKPEEDKELGSLKRIERLLNEAALDGRSLMGALVGVYDLRLADAHLPSEKASESLRLVGINDDGNYQDMAKQMIKNIAKSLASIATGIKAMDLEKST